MQVWQGLWNLQEYYCRQLLSSWCPASSAGSSLSSPSVFPR